MKKNVGTLDALIRIMIGLAGLVWVTARMVRHPYQKTPVVLALLFGMKVAEGIVRYCPLLAMFRISTVQSCDRNKKPYNVAKFPRCR